MLTSEVTKALLPPTGEVRPKIGLTARTGAWVGSDAPGRARLFRKPRRGDGQCGHFCQSAAPDGRMGRLSGECQLSKALTVSLWAKNLFDLKYYANVSESTLGDDVLPAAPRTFGVTLSVKY
jgi:hypothetical protein